MDGPRFGGSTTGYRKRGSEPGTMSHDPAPQASADLAPPSPCRTKFPPTICCCAFYLSSPYAICYLPSTTRQTLLAAHQMVFTIRCRLFTAHIHAIGLLPPLCYFATRQMLFDTSCQPYTTSVLLSALGRFFAILPFLPFAIRCWLFTTRVLLSAFGRHFAISAVCYSLLAIHHARPATGLRPLFCRFAIFAIAIRCWLFTARVPPSAFWCLFSILLLIECHLLFAAGCSPPIPLKLLTQPRLHQHRRYYLKRLPMSTGLYSLRSL